MTLPNHSTVSLRPIVDQEELGSYNEEEEVLDQGGVHEYNLVRDRAPRQIQPPVRYGFEELGAYALLTCSGDPSTFREALNSPETDRWMGAMQKEMESLKKNETWDLVPLPKGKRDIGWKSIYKKRPELTEKEVEKFNARLVAKVFSQHKGIDYDEIFSP